MEMPNREQQEQKCIICEQHRQDGITICSEFICNDCESEIIKTDALDARYPYFITQMRRIWYKKDA
jgi:hypothetical protein